MKIAIVSSMGLPVPAVRGGAVERLINDLIDNNENEKKCDIDLYTVYDDELSKYKYKNTKVVSKRKNKLENLIERIINKFLHIFRIHFIFRIEWLKTAISIRNKKYDYILLENNMYLYKYVYFFIRNINTKFIYHMHNDINEDDKTPKNYKFIERTSSKIIVVSEFLKNRLNSIKESDKIEVLYNCINLDKFKRKIDLNKVEKYKQIYNITENKNIFMYIGRYSDEKGLLELVKAFNLRNRENEILIIVGEALDKNNYYHRQIIDEIEKNKNNIIINFGSINYNELAEVYYIADVVVIPTIVEEAFGMVALESLVMNKKIIATESGGMKEILKDKALLISNKANLVSELDKAMTEILEEEYEYSNKINFDAFDKGKYLETLLHKAKIN